MPEKELMYWKPGSARPGKDDKKKRKRAPNASSRDDYHHIQHDEMFDLPETTRRDASGSASTTLLEMNFMKRSGNTAAGSISTAKSDANGISKDFDTPLARSLLNRGNHVPGKLEILVCEPLNRSPQNIILGRRGFGGFNKVVEAAYKNSVREVAKNQSKDREKLLSRSDSKMLDRIEKFVLSGNKKAKFNNLTPNEEKIMGQEMDKKPFQKKDNIR